MTTAATQRHDKSYRANASQFYVAAELCRRGYAALVTIGNTPNTDILCSNRSGTKFVHIQVKTFVPGNKTCSVGEKAEHSYGENFFWVLSGIPEPSQNAPYEFFVIPSAVMAENVKERHDRGLETPGKDGRKHNHTSVRAVAVSKGVNDYHWPVIAYRDRWDLIENKLAD